MEKLVIGLLGPRTYDKLKIINRLLDYPVFIKGESPQAIYANTIDFTIIYEFSHKFDKIRLKNYIPKGKKVYDFTDLEKIKTIDRVFETILSEKFVSNTRSISLEFPLREGVIPDNNIIDRIEIIDNRGYEENSNILHIKNVARKNYDQYIVDLILFSLYDYTVEAENFKNMLRNLGLRNGLGPSFIYRTSENTRTSEKLRMQNIAMVKENILNNIKDLTKGYMIWK